MSFSTGSIEITIDICALEKIGRLAHSTLSLGFEAIKTIRYAGRWLDLIRLTKAVGKILVGAGILSSVLFTPRLVAQENPARIRAIPVKVTAYNPVRSQTDNSPFITASNKRVRVGMVALSRDLEREFGFRFGDTVYLYGFGRFVFEDRMHRRKRRQVDILMFNPQEARKFGVKTSYLFLLEEAGGAGGRKM